MSEKNKLSIILKELRINSGLTQSQLAKEIGLSMSSIRSYENGLREPNSKAMVALERFFGVSGEYLRGEIDNINFKNNSEKIQSKLDNVIEEFVHFKDNFNYASQSKQDESTRALEKMILYINSNLLPDFAPSGSGDFICKFIDAYSALNEDGIKEILKRLDELIQLPQYKK